MRYVFLISLLFLNATVTTAQTKADFEQVMKKFVEFYNHTERDSIYKMCSEKWKTKAGKIWSREELKELRRKYGEIDSFKLISFDKSVIDDRKEPMAVFTMVFNKYYDFQNTHESWISLDEESKIYGFNFITTSHGVTK